MRQLAPIIIIFALLSACGSSDNDATPSTTGNNCIRTGAVCKDGTQSTATGSGACAGHGGIDRWLCK